MADARKNAGARGSRGARLAAARLALRQAEESAGLRGSSVYEMQHPVASGCYRGLWHYLGSCPAGALHLRGSTALLLAAAALRQGSHGWCGVIGGEGLGWCAAAELGLDLSRVLHVPSDTLDPSGVLTAAGVLLDGVDTLLLGARAAQSLTPASRRRLLARARERGALLLSPVPWEGARTLVCRLSHLDDGVSGAADRATHAGGVVVPLRLSRAMPFPASGCQGAAVEMPGGYLRSLSWTLSDPGRGLGGTVLTHGPRGLRVREPAATPATGPAATPATLVPLQGAG